MRFTLMLAGAVVALDMVTKMTVMARMALGQAIPLIEGLLTLRYIRNPGAAYGLLAGQNWLLVTLAVLVIAGLLWYARQARGSLERTALGLLLGGAGGNMVNRMLWGPVTDFIEVNPLVFIFQVFNLADVAITSGVILLCGAAWRQAKRSNPAKDSSFTV